MYTDNFLIGTRELAEEVFQTMRNDWSITGTSGRLIQWRNTATNENILLPPMEHPLLTAETPLPRVFSEDTNLELKRALQGFNIIGADDSVTRVDPDQNKAKEIIQRDLMQRQDEVLSILPFTPAPVTPVDQPSQTLVLGPPISPQSDAVLVDHNPGQANFQDQNGHYWFIPETVQLNPLQPNSPTVGIDQAFPDPPGLIDKILDPFKNFLGSAGGLFPDVPDANDFTQSVNSVGKVLVVGIAGFALLQGLGITKRLIKK